MNIFVLVGMGGLFLVTVYSLFRLLEYKRVNDISSTTGVWKISFLLIAVSFLFFFMYFNSTMQELQMVDTITTASSTITVQDNSYVEYFSYMSYMTGMVVMNFVFNAAVLFKSFEIFGRKRMNTLKLRL